VSDRNWPDVQEVRDSAEPAAGRSLGPKVRSQSLEGHYGDIGRSKPTEFTERDSHDTAENEAVSRHPEDLAHGYIICFRWR
jgi:hypothetical protein